jgi:hypothetical protein
MSQHEGRKIEKIEEKRQKGKEQVIGRRFIKSEKRIPPSVSSERAALPPGSVL